MYIIAVYVFYLIVGSLFAYSLGTLSIEHDLKTGSKIKSVTIIVLTIMYVWAAGIGTFTIAKMMERRYARIITE